MGPESTCWTVIRGASAGNRADREEFARLYEPVVRSYLLARWPGIGGEVDDAVQEVFLACFRPGGVLERADPGRPNGFRAFLYGVARNVARQIEARRARLPEQPPAADGLDALPGEDDSLSAAFDRAWAKALMREAARRQGEEAARKGAAALRRVELLRLRFHDGLPIREIARRWGEDAARLHHEYSRARDEFRAALREVVAFHHPGPADQIDHVCGELVALLG